MTNDASQTSPTDLGDLSDALDGVDDLADAINSALQDADAALSKKRDKTEAKPSSAAPSEEVIEILDEPDLPSDVPDEAPATPAPNATSEPSAKPTAREAELYDRLLRTVAEFENYKKRVARDKEEAQRFAGEKAVLALLPILDNFERALTFREGAEVSPQALIDGVHLIHRQLKDMLGRLGVLGFDSIGKPFDPAKHQAVMLKPRADVPAGQVVEEFQRGYFLHDRLLRPAMVVVSQAAPDTNETPSETPAS